MSGDITINDWIVNRNGEFHIQASRYGKGFYCLGVDDWLIDNDVMIDHFWGLVGGDTDWIAAEEYFRDKKGAYLAKAETMEDAISDCSDLVLAYYNSEEV